ncbi:hypothetical protein CARN8_2550003 [mine drainage metagenome]|uniref:Uncharacterized protein n=1 Tax=mine drainage metagenome TaxID=410659 RepID=A0A3P3ZN48_9ZZZZ
MRFQLSTTSSPTQRTAPIGTSPSASAREASSIARRMKSMSVTEILAPGGIRTPGLCLRRAALYPAELRAQDASRLPGLRRYAGAGNVFEEVELMIDEAAIEFSHAIGVAEEIGARIGKIVPRAVGDVVREFDLFHLRTVDRMRAKVARNR